MPGKALFYQVFWHCNIFDTVTDFVVNQLNLDNTAVFSSKSSSNLGCDYYSNESVLKAFSV